MVNWRKIKRLINIMVILSLGKINTKILFFYYGLGPFYETDIKRHLGTNDTSDSASYHHPGLSLELAKFLFNKRNVKVVGTDTINTDVGDAINFPLVNLTLNYWFNLKIKHFFRVHQFLQKSGVSIIESLTNLDQLIDNPTGFFAFVLPIKIRNGSGGPTRVVAIKDD